MVCLLACNAYNERKQPDVPADLGPVLAAAVGSYHTCAVQADGQLVCFGDSTLANQCDVPPDLGPVLAVAAGHSHTCAVRTDGQLVCFGDNDFTDVPADLRTSPGSCSASFSYLCCADRWSALEWKVNSPPADHAERCRRGLA